ncbi:uncharacterized protein LOC108115408 [Drosophila eugracilis]|uniref:uncharacterized protein LOC108115408 n=1 Tax=Drosophila eugracilis TaxID=29029 RepID=UPI0007E6B123|nr:uncharacterized protein LOC108115408 [Drosophila eugracilis]
MFIETDILKFETYEMDTLDLEIYEKERQGKRYQYPFVLADSVWYYKNDATQISEGSIDVFGKANGPPFCADFAATPAPIQINSLKVANVPSNSKAEIKNYVSISFTLQQSASTTPTSSTTQKPLSINVPRNTKSLLNLKMLETVSNSTSAINTITEAEIVGDINYSEDKNTTYFPLSNSPSSSSYSSICSVPATKSDSPNTSQQSNPPTSKSNGNQKRSSSLQKKKLSNQKRGRPPKKHADEPDLELMKRMNENERSAYGKRLANNEASRISRRKIRNRQEEEKIIELDLVAENIRLRSWALEVASHERKLKDFLIKKTASSFRQEQH